MAAKNKGLGKGLGSLLGEVADIGRPVTPPEEKKTSGELIVKTRLVEPNRSQPRKTFNEEELNELADSIRVHGIIDPLIVTKKGDRYEIVAGERRWRAAKIVGLNEIPVLVRDYTEENAAQIALIENIQRKDLNPIEEAAAYQKLIDDYHLTQEELSERVGKSRSNVANSLRLLKLPETVRDMLVDGRLSTGHAKVILGLEDEESQVRVAVAASESNASVRETEDMVASLLRETKKKPRKPVAPLKNQVAYEDAAKVLTEKLGTKVTIKRKGDNKGTIQIEYYSLEDYERITSHIQ